VKFLVDANLPRRLAHWLNSLGHDAVHTLDLPNGNDTDDAEVLRIANAEQRIVITKDGDFELPFALGKGPPGLILIGIGNIVNRDLLEVLDSHRDALFGVAALGAVIEVKRNALIVRE